MEKGAVISECGTYRYKLWRGGYWTSNPLVIIGLNPSTADAEKDDPTIRRCARFAKDLGFDGLVMLNLFAFRDTSPDDMRKAADPVGPENNDVLLAATGTMVAAWGVNGTFRGRDIEIKKMFSGRLKCLGLSKDGHPRHPLYLPLDSTLKEYA